MDPAQIAYDAFAPFYDGFTSDHEYDDWTATLESLARENGLSGRRLLDVACGTGKSFMPFLRRGYRVTACDISAAMLERARGKADGRARLVRADMRALPRLGRFDLVTCLDDALNYLLADGDLTLAFRSAARAMAPAGVAVFDVNTLGAYRSLFAGDRCTEVDGVFFAWRGMSSAELPAGAETTAVVEAFGPGTAGGLARVSTEHRQRHHTDDDVREALAAAGLRALAVRGVTPDGVLHRSVDELAHTKRLYVAGHVNADERKEGSDAEDQAPGRADRAGRRDQQVQLTTGEAAPAATPPGLADLPRRPRLKSTIDVFEASDGSVHLFRGGDDDFEIEPDGRPVAALLAAMDGERGIEALAAPGFSRSDVATVVGQLWELGAVEDAADDDRLTARDLRRYDRQLRYFGDVAPPGVPRGEYQRRLAESRVAVLGLGGLGGWAALALACSGVGTIVGVDGDTVEWSNMNRQVLYRESDVGHGKAEAAARTIAAFNSDVRFEPVARMLTSQGDVEAVIAGADFVIDAADTPVHDIERWVNAACFAVGVPYLMMSQFPPLVRLGPTYVPGSTGCYACQESGWRERYPLFDELAEHRRRRPCPAAAFGPACGLIGSQVAMDVVHHLSGVSPPATLGTALTVDLRTLEIRRERVARLAGCEVCAGGEGAVFAAKRVQTSR